MSKRGFRAFNDVRIILREVRSFFRSVDILKAQNVQLQPFKESVVESGFIGVRSNPVLVVGGRGSEAFPFLMKLTGIEDSVRPKGNRSRYLFHRCRRAAPHTGDRQGNQTERKTGK